MEPDDDEHDRDEETAPDMSEWLSTASTTTCPACGAPGALMLGGGVFCPACGRVTPGYGPPSN